MEIKVDIDDAKILKEVLSGKTKQEIEKSIVNHIKDEIISDILNKVSDYKSNICNNIMFSINDKLRKDILDYVKAKVTPIEIRKQIKDGDWDNWLDETVGEVMADFVETALSDWMTLRIVIESGKKKKNKKEIELHG